MYIFKKLIVDFLTLVINKLGYRVLSVEDTEEPEDPKVPEFPGVDPENFSLTWLLLKPGTYKITVTSVSPSMKLGESDHSNSVLYTVE